MGRGVCRVGVPPSTSMTPFLRKILGMNWMLTLFMYGLLIFGVFAIQSAARHLNAPDSFTGGAGLYFADKQKFWIVVGSIVFFATALVDYRWIRWLGLPFYVTSLALMLVAMKQDHSVHQLSIGSFSFQPAQLGVSAGLILIAWLLQDLPKLHRWFGVAWVRVGLIAMLAAIPFLIVMKMGDMGSALVWGPVAVVALLIGGVPFRMLSFMALIGIGLIPVLYFVVLPMVSERGPERINLWLDMMEGKEVDIKGNAYAPYHVSMAVGKSGWSGIGWNNTDERVSLHARKFIPWETAHNDFIFAVIAEEFGYRGSLLLVAAFGVLLIQGLWIAFYSRDLTGRLLAAGIVALLFAHVFENIGMCVLLMPITGIPLPLVSYSGTFVVITMFLLGLLQSVWVHRFEKPALKAERG